MRTFVAFAFVLSAAIAAGAVGGSIGCGSSSSDGAAPDGGAPDATPGDGTAADGGEGDGVAAEASTRAPDGALCGSAACTGIAGACGTLVDACGQTVACERCRYTSEPGVAGDWVSLALGAGGAPTLAIGSANVVQLATRSGGSWQVEQVAPQGDAGSIDLFGLDLALAPDGTPWVTYVALGGGSASVWIARRVGGAWTVEGLGVGVAAAVAIASDGTPYVAYAGSVTGQAGGTFGTVLARYAGGGWTRTLVSASNLVRGVALAMHGTDPHVAWHDDSAVRYAAPTASGITVEDVDTFSSQGVGVDMSLAVDAAGRPHVAYYPYGTLMHAVRDGAWKHETVSGSGHGNGPVRIAASPLGGVALGSVDDVMNTLGVGFLSGGWSLETVVPRCQGSTPRMDMAFDPAGTLVIAHTCTYPGVTLLTQSGIFPPGFGAACDSIVTTLCNDACACPQRAGGYCCVSGDCLSPPSYCPAGEKDVFCGSATVDPNAVLACRDALPQTVCNPDGGVGAVLPSACEAIRQ